MALTFSENVLRYHDSKGKTLIVAPLAVSHQFVREGEKFGFKVNMSRNGETRKGINVTNYERLSKFDPSEFSCVVVDESGRIKNFDGKQRKEITNFFKSIPYRLLCTATPAPNDFMELGTSAEALGVMTRNQMLAMFFVNDGESTQQWRLKGHAKGKFWQWVSTWARACRKPSDLGFDDEGFILPKLTIHRHVLPYEGEFDGLFHPIARTLEDQRNECRRSLRRRCEKVAELVPSDRPAIVWCHLNTEGDLLEKLIPDAVQVQGSDKDEVKEERLVGFSTGNIRVLISKPRIAGWGLNWQHCHDVFYFPSHSHESFYQSIRRCWRFGQKNPVDCHIVTTESEKMVVDSMIRKERQSDEMFAGIIRYMGKAMEKKRHSDYVDTELPSWMGNGR